MEKEKQFKLFEFSDVELAKRVKNRFDDYDGFVNKFKSKKTTDDCYTPKVELLEF